MPETSLEDITKFLECKRVAFVGVSRDPHHFSRALFREFVAKGYDPVPLNPQAAQIEGRKCFAHLSEITPPVDAALLLTGAPDATDDAVRECNEADIRNIWIYKDMHDSKDHEQAIDFSRSHGTAVVEGHCPFMFLPHPGLVHRVHRFISKATGSYPA